MRAVIISTVVVALTCATACAPPPRIYTPTSYSPPPSRPTTSIEAGTPISLTQAQQARVRAGVAKSMKDPESARFGEMAATKDSKNVITVCGMVNGKNSYGGYVGMSPYIGVLSNDANGQFAVVDIGSSTKGRPIVASLCRDSGIPSIS